MKGNSGLAPVFGDIATLESLFDSVLPEQARVKGPSEGLSNKPLEDVTSGVDDFVFAMATGNDNELHDHDDHDHEHDSLTIAQVGSVASGKTIAPNAPIFETDDLAYQRPDGVGGGPRGGGDDTNDDTTNDPPPAYGTNDLFAEYFSGMADTNDDDYFNIEIEFYGDWTAYQPYMEAFALSAQFLSSIMAEGLWNDPVSFNTFDPLGTNTFEVDDVLIEARLTDIDGPGKILGGANVFSARDATAPDPYTAVVGLMEFDTSDAEALTLNGTWDDVVLHEMIHALGFGTLWDNYYPDIVTTTEEQVAGQNTRRPNDDVFAVTSAVYNGAAGNAEYASETGVVGDKITVETEGGSGTALAHWDEADHGDELMTGYLDTTNGAHLADWSIAALADIGYHVDLAALAGDNANELSADINLMETYDVATSDYIFYPIEDTAMA